ncbi:hypothetical protein [Pedobacter sp. B4-66]|uniref:hypothetical protein n=1 Tax=Pedobacter sp. B4-66 TaxID=2817280 RepID=UPI001BDAB9F6|nr:hypothetical protein [Pedobacter sp. B4-66]
MKIASALIYISILTSCTQASAKNSLQQYYDAVHHANVLICKGDFEGANKVFNAGLKLTKYPFYTDINNAIFAQVNSKSPDTSKIVSYLKMLQHKGICVHEEYEKRDKFRPFLGLVKEAECHKVVNTAARKSVQDAIELDQKPRKDTRGTEHPAVQSEMRHVDSFNYGLVRKILIEAENKNIPIENLIGNDASTSLFTLIQHNASWGRLDRFQIERLIIKGVLEASSTASNLDYFYKIGYIKKDKDVCDQYGLYGNSILLLVYISGPYKPAFISKLSKECYASISKNRKKMYLPDVLEEAKVRAFAFYNFRFGFLYDTNMIAMSREDADAMEKELSSKTKIIKYAGKEDFDFNREY